MNLLKFLYYLLFYLGFLSGTDQANILYLEDNIGCEIDQVKLSPSSKENDWLDLLYLKENFTLIAHSKGATLSQENQNFEANLALVDAWKKALDLDVDELIRENPNFLPKVDESVKNGLDWKGALDDAIQTLGKPKPTWPELQALWKRGNGFNAKRKFDCQYSEVWIDSYDDFGEGKIVSLKATTLSEIQESTFENYLKELKSKYPGDAKIANSDIGTSLKGKHYLEIPDSNKSFYESIETFFDENVGTHVEVVQTTQKTAKNIWTDGQLAISHWYSGEPDYGKWPDYGQMHELIAGPSDAVLDEITGIPITIKTLYGVMTDAEQRQAFSQLFTSEGMGQLIDGLKKEAEATIGDEEKLTYTSSKTVVSVASMLFTGGITKTGKGLSLLETMIDGMGGLAKYKKLTAFLGEIKDVNRYKPEVFNIIKKHFDEVFTKFPTTHDQLENIIKWAGTDNFSELITKLHRLKDIPGLEHIITDMGSYGTKFKGAKFVVDYVSKKGDNFIAKIKRFESPTEITLSDGTTKLRRYEVELTDGTKIEFKDWSDWKSWSNSSFKNQFVNDLANPEFTELGKLKWIFNRTNIDEITLKSKALKALRKADGSPADELGQIPLEQIRKLLDDDIIRESNKSSKLLEFIEDPNNFKQIFEIAE